jgi:hypothetical protein
VNTVYSSGITSSAIGTGTLTLGSATISSNANTTGGDRTIYNAVAFSSSPTTTVFGDGTYTGILNFQTGSFALGTSAARTFTINTTTNIANNISGSASSITKGGTGTVNPLRHQLIHGWYHALSRYTPCRKNAASLYGTGTITLNGGTLQLASDTAATYGNNVVVGANVSIVADRVTSGVGVTQTLGTLSIGAYTLTIDRGSNDTSAGGITFSSTSALTGNAAITTTTSGVLATLTGAITGTGNSLTIGGSGDTTFLAGLNTSTSGQSH